MRYLAIIALLFTSPTFAADKCPPIPKVHHEPFKCKPGLKKVQCGGKTRCLKPGQCPDQQAEEQLEVTYIVPKLVYPPPEAKTVASLVVRVLRPQEQVSNWHIGPYIQFGSGIREPRSVFTHQYSTPNNGGMLEWDVGFHAHYLPARLGGRLYYAGEYGVGSQLELYIWQGKGMEAHLDAGFLYYSAGPAGVDGRNYLSAIDINRVWDFQYGLGIEYPVTHVVVLTLDGRISQPLTHQAADPWTHEGWNVATNAMNQFHLLGGVLFRVP